MAPAAWWWPGRGVTARDRHHLPYADVRAPDGYVPAMTGHRHDPHRAAVTVLAPSPGLTVTVEELQDGRPEIHVHAGGQGFWVARMVSALGVDARLVAALGGEAGDVLTGLVEREGVGLRRVPTAAANGGYVQDRRGGERRTLVDMPAAQLSRHDVDELYGAVLVEALEAGVCVLTGPPAPDVLPADVYERLGADLCENGCRVVADLSGDALAAALRGGLSVLKVSHDELVEAGLAEGESVEQLVAGIERVADAGVETVVVSRADEPALALLGGQVVEVRQPALQAVDHHGAGDSMTAGIASSLARGAKPVDAVRFGAAAGALNVTRRGLGTGRRWQVEELSRRVEMREVR
jgi:1-phosphofructokinase